MAAGSFCKLLEAFLELLLPFYLHKIIDTGLAAGNRAYIWQCAGRMLLFTAIGLASVLLCQYYAAYSSSGIAADMRSALMEKISNFSYREIDKFGAPTLINRLTADVNQVRDAASMLVRMVTRAPFLCVGAVIMATYEAPQLSPIFILIVPAFFGGLFVIIKKSVPLVKQAQKRLDGLALVLRENLGGIRVIRALVRQPAEKKRAARAAEGLSGAYIALSDISGLTSPLTLLIVNAGIIAVLYFGAREVGAGALSKGRIVSLSGYITQITSALLILSNLVTLFTKASASAGRLVEVLDTRPSLEYPSILPEIPLETKQAVSVRNISYSYAGDGTAIKNLSFSIAKGSVFGITGVTGSGKTTLINLIARFYDTDSGEILLDGVNVRDYPIRALTGKIGIVPQRSVLFSGTVAENIRFGKMDASDNDIIKALELSQALDFVNAMGGIDAVISEAGKNLSGGQKQRLAIARALVKKPDLLIMDDSLSALDYRTDSRIRQALKTALPGAAFIVVSQRISSVVSADEILVLENGEMAGLGAHAELLESCAVYREICEIQTALYRQGQAPLV
jgi:ATP-binding cassette subfamily B protein